MARELENIFNECLERMMAGESLEACLSDYPKWADELRGLLDVSGQVLSAARNIEARPEFRTGLSRRVLQATPVRSEPRSWLWRLPAWATGLAAAFLLMVGAGGAVVAAATGSQPDQLLYPVKLGFEQAQLAMVLTPVKEGLRLQQAETRAMEIAYLAGKGEAGLIESVAKNMETALTGQSANGLSMQPTLPPARSMSPEPSASTPFPAPLVAPQAPAQVVAPTPDKVPFSTQPPNSTPPAAVSPPSAAAPGKAAVSAVKPAEDGDKYKDKENNMVLASQRRTIQTLEEALKKSSPDAKPALEKALERAKKAYDQAFDRNRDDNDGKNRDSRH